MVTPYSSGDELRMLTFHRRGGLGSYSRTHNRKLQRGVWVLVRDFIAKKVVGIASTYMKNIYKKEADMRRNANFCTREFSWFKGRGEMVTMSALLLADAIQCSRGNHGSLGNSSFRLRTPSQPQIGTGFLSCQQRTEQDWMFITPDESENVKSL